jgi:hypothetical protein
MFTKASQRLTLFSWMMIAIILILSTLHTIQGARVTKIYERGTLASKSIIIEFNARLDPNQNIAIQVFPTTQIDSDIDGSRLIITFQQPLAYNQTYRLELVNVRDTRGKQTSKTYQFMTPRSEILYLQRNESGTDNLIKRTVGDPSSEKIIFSHSRIGDFAATHNNEGYLVVIDEPTAALQTTLYRVDETESRVLSPPKGIVMQLKSSTTDAVFLMRTIDMETLQNHFFTYDWHADNFTEITHRDGSSIHPSSFFFTNDGKTILYTDAADGALYMLDPSGTREPLSFGTVTSVRRILPDDSGLYLETKPAHYLLLKNDASQIDYLDDVTIAESTILMDGSTISLKNAYSLTKPSQLLIKSFEGNDTTLTLNDSNDALLRNITVSPNDQFISYNRSPVPNTYDAYRIKPEARLSELVIVDMAGEEIDVVNGTHIQWL